MARHSNNLINGRQLRAARVLAGLSRRQNVYPADVALIFPIAKAGKPRAGA